MTIDEMKKKKQEMGYTFEMIARMAGVSIATVKKIFGGEIKSPRYDTLQKLEAVFAKTYPQNVREMEFKYDPYDTGYTGEDYRAFPEYASVEIVNGKVYPKYPGASDPESEFCAMTFDQLVNNPRNGSYTYEDYLNFPGSIRVEIVRGRIYAMSAPTFVHQQIQGKIYMQIASYIDSSHGRCIAGTAPTDIVLFDDELTTVQPGVYVICERDIITEKCVKGAPDFVVEILSPSTSAYDKTIKFEDYRNAGVKEIWFVDYDKKQILVYDLRESKDSFRCMIYGMRDQVPVNIYDGDLKIDFAVIDDYIQEILKEG